MNDKVFRYLPSVVLANSTGKVTERLCNNLYLLGCDCTDYAKHAWCSHTCAVYEHRGDVQSGEGGWSLPKGFIRVPMSHDPYWYVDLYLADSTSEGWSVVGIPVDEKPFTITEVGFAADSDGRIDIAGTVREVLQAYAFTLKDMQDTPCESQWHKKGTTTSPHERVISRAQIVWIDRNARHPKGTWEDLWDRDDGMPTGILLEDCWNLWAHKKCSQCIAAEAIPF